MSPATGGSAPRALRLESPKSHRRLFGLDGDRVFSAPGEALAYELVGSDLAPRRLSAVRPVRPPEGVLVWLPFWRVRFAAEVSGDGSGVSVLRSVFESSNAYVRGFTLLNALYVGDPGLGLTLDGFEPGAREEIPPVCLGVRLPSQEALSIARLFLLEKADRISDVTGARVQVEVAELELLLVPFDRSNRFLQMLVGPATRFREETVVDLRGMDQTYEEMKRVLR